MQKQPRVSLFHPRYALSFKSNLRKYFHLPNIPQWFNHNISNAISSLCHTAAGAEETGEVVGIVGGVGPGVQIIVVILEIFLHLLRWIQLLQIQILFKFTCAPHINFYLCTTQGSTVTKSSTSVPSAMACSPDIMILLS